MTNTYWLLATDGNRYGPVEDATLAQWARDGRVVLGSVLQHEGSGAQLYASQVPAVAAVFSPAGYADPYGGHPYPSHTAQAQPYVAQPLGAYAYGQPVPAYGPAVYPQPAGHHQPLAYANPYLQPAGPHAAVHSLTQFNVALMVLLTIVTFGIFPVVHFGLMHGKLPRNRVDDPTAGTAVGLHFVPIFGVYWMFFVNLRLIDRLNEQRAYAGLRPGHFKGLFLAAAIVLLVPYVNVFAVVLFPVYLCQIQGMVNELVRVTRGQQR
ncbi:MAG TPA: DUF4234 domain-containing protein [Humisphaera sp.]